MLGCNCSIMLFKMCRLPNVQYATLQPTSNWLQAIVSQSRTAIARSTRLQVVRKFRKAPSRAVTRCRRSCLFLLCCVSCTKKGLRRCQLYRMSRLLFQACSCLNVVVIICVVLVRHQNRQIGSHLEQRQCTLTKSSIIHYGINFRFFQFKLRSRDVWLFFSSGICFALLCST